MTPPPISRRTLLQQGSAAVLQVKDNGPDIAAEAQQYIFDRFYRGDPSREGNGTGLGLALVRSIAELHQGQITVSSTLGQGSCFRVVLPLVAAPLSPPED